MLREQSVNSLKHNPTIKLELKLELDLELHGVVKCFEEKEVLYSIRITDLGESERALNISHTVGLPSESNCQLIYRHRKLSRHGNQ